MSMTPAGPAPGAQARAALPSFLGRFTVLRGAPRELWLVLLVKLAGIAAYAIMNTTFVLWLCTTSVTTTSRRALWWRGGPRP